MRLKRRWIAALFVLTLCIALRHLQAAQAESIRVSALPPVPISTPAPLSMVELHSTMRHSPWQFHPAVKAKDSASSAPAASSSPAKPTAGTKPVAALPKSARDAPAATTTTMVRVVVASVPTDLDVAVSGKGGLSSPDGATGFGLTENQAYKITVAQSGLMLDQQPIENGAWLEPEPGGLLWVAGRWYRGRVQIIYDGSQLLAVNWIDLENYLASVVGSEMPQDWHPEALKAQAIAARSYALAHIQRPASTWFDLGADERWQAYQGVAAEAESTRAAVGVTLGQLLVGRDQQILESLYASTENLTRTAHEGIGMSQYGAEQMASAGQPYQAILSRYYPAASIAVLEESS